MVFAVLGTAFGVIRRRPGLLLPAALSFAAALLFNVLMVSEVANLVYSFSLSDLLLVLAGLLLMAVFTTWVMGVYPLAVQSSLKKQRRSWSGLLKQTAQRLPALLWTYFIGFLLAVAVMLPGVLILVFTRLASAGVALGALALGFIVLLAAVVLIIAASFALPAVVMLEHSSGLGAIRRSFAIGKAHVGKVLGIMLAIAVPNVLIAWLLMGPGRILPELTISFVVYAAATIFLGTMSNVSAAVFYLTVGKKKRH